MMKRFHSRGQTLAVFALTMLLVALMVTMTLSIGTKVKEKMELETAADAAAYSQAVAIARTYNNVALLNRALMSNMVAMAGVQSLISWSGYYRAVLNVARKAYNTPKTEYEIIALAACACPGPTCNPPLCACANKAISDISKTQDDLQKEDDDVEKRAFKPYDKAAGEEAAKQQLSSVWEEQKKLFNDQLIKKTLSGSRDIAKAIAEEASKGNKWSGDEVTALSSTEKVNKREQEAGGCEKGADGAACERRAADHKNHYIWATMGTRGHPFVTGRSGGAGLIMAKLIQVVPPPDIITVTNEGSGYFADGPNPSHANMGKTGNEHAWGDDNGSVTVFFLRQTGPCPPGIPGSGNPEAWVRSNDTSDQAGLDQHFWTDGPDKEDENGRAKSHTMGKCVKCPGMWPSHMDYNWNKLEDKNEDLFGQPKTYAVLQRDLTKRPDKKADPWNLVFKFQFAKSGSGVEFNNSGLQLSSMPGVDVSHPVALGTGLAYYHRVGGGYKEPPNFLNPYWRATLVSGDIDKKKKDSVEDIKAVLKGISNQEAEKAVDALDKAGYKAW